MEWGVVRVTPKKEKDVVYTNYQFLQVLNLDAKDIDILCHKTINFLDGVAYKNPEYAKLYLMGDALDEYDDKIYSKTHDNVAKALMLNNDMLKDPYVQKHIIHSLNKKIKESYMGKLIVDGNFSMMVSDPYAFAEYMFGLPVKGLLSRDQHYNGYLNRKGKNKAVALRAPLTWRSEVVKMNLVKEVNVCDWYKHLDTGVVIYNVHGCDCMLHADAD
jgi:hypothetical protein